MNLHRHKAVRTTSSYRPYLRALYAALGATAVWIVLQLLVMWVILD